MSFAVGYGVTPWVLEMGYQNASLVAAFVGMTQVFMFLIFIRWGKNFRAQSTRRFDKYVADMQSDGTNH